MNEEIKKYEIYLEYDCRGEFNIKYKKRAKIEMIITFPNRKVPNGRKELDNFINKYVIDFSEYYSKINYHKYFKNNNLVEST